MELNSMQNETVLQQRVGSYEQMCSSRQAWTQWSGAFRFKSDFRELGSCYSWTGRHVSEFIFV